jgi:excisionase family DNA binding protein
MADYHVLSVHEAGDALGVSMERVRQMIHAGQLEARRSSAGWLIPADAVAERSRNVHNGRPPEARTAWSAIALLTAAMACASQSAPDHAVSVAEVVPDRKLRYRVLRLLASMPDPVTDVGPWYRLLSARGEVRHLWAHPGVLDRLASDARVSRGGAAAVPAGHDGLTGRPGRRELYVGEADAEDLIRQYRMREDRDGRVHLVIVPSSVPLELAPKGGVPVAVPAAASDLLDEDDPRARYAAAIQLQSHRDALRTAGWLDRIDVGLAHRRERDRSQSIAKTGLMQRLVK